MSSAMDEADNDMLWSDSKEDGSVRIKCEEDKALIVTVTPSGKDR